jgi:hypothetical protein
MFDAPHPVAATPPSDYIQPNLGHGLRIWWAFFWPTSLVTTALSIGITILLRSVYEDTTVPGSLIGPVIRYHVYVVNYVVAFVVMAYILRKNFRHFRIGLLSNHGGDGAEPLPPTFRRTARVWWTYSWRSFLYRIIVLFAVSFPLGWITGFLIAIFKQVPAIPVLVNLVSASAVDGAVGLFVIYSNILDEDISDFRVALLPRAVSSGAIAAPAAPCPPETLSPSPAES